jgi:integrase
MTETMNGGATPKRLRRGRGEHSIYWDESKCCWAGAVSLGHDATGRRRRVKAYGKTKTEVRAKLRELVKERETGVKSAARYTVAEAVNDWLARGLRTADPNTVAKCTSLANKHIIPIIGKAKLRDLTADDVDAWLDTRAKHLATRSLRECHAVLRRSITFAQRRDKVLRNVAELVGVPTGRPGRPSKALTLEQATAVIAVAKESRIHAYVVLSLLTGIRTEEARALTWDRVELDPPDGQPPHVMVWRSVRRHGDTKTQKSRRTLGLPAHVVAALVSHRDAQHDDRTLAGTAWHDSDLVFTTRVGTPLDAANVRRAFRAIVVHAGLGAEWTPRELRHSFVSLMSAQGTPVEEIARLVGHSSSATTEAVYRKELRPIITKGAEVMDGLF